MNEVRYFTSRKLYYPLRDKIRAVSLLPHLSLLTKASEKLRILSAPFLINLDRKVEAGFIWREYIRGLQAARKEDDNDQQTQRP